MRNNNRAYDELRPVFLGVGFAKNALGSCFVKFGNTHVLCTATIEEKVPFFLRNTKTGWITAEYGMLPCSCKERIEREAIRGKQNGRTQEIQRLIGRSLRSVVDLSSIGERQIKIDCDVLEADGGTRTASITGGFVALYQVLKKLYDGKKIAKWPVNNYIAAVSCGIVDKVPMLDLDYSEDSMAQVDANFVMTEKGEFVEIQASAEKTPFSELEYQKIVSFAKEGICTLIEKQKEALKES
ncbi:MAG: ribonuclease PH [Alphaproteobacteria bacterium]